MNKQTTVINICAYCAGTAYAHTGATGIDKERMDAMKEMSDKSKIVADMYKGNLEFKKSAPAEAANTFVQHGTGIAELFPDTKTSRTGSSTESLLKIWENWEDFNARIIDFIASSEKLQTTIVSTDDTSQLNRAFFQTSKSCSGCHKLYHKTKTVRVTGAVL